MTEQEAMIRLDFIRCALLGGTKPEIIPNEDNVELMDNAIKALEEVQQYRAIGTVDECREAVDKMKPKKTAIEAIKVHICPVCGSSGIYDYCGNCGQRVQMLSD